MGKGNRYPNMISCQETYSDGILCMKGSRIEILQKQNYGSTDIVRTSKWGNRIGHA